MLSKYFIYKTQTNEFIHNNEKIISELKNKNVIVCGDSEYFLELNDKYKYNQFLNIVAFVEYSNHKNHLPDTLGIKEIKPEHIKNEIYDYILILSGNSFRIKEQILSLLEENETRIKELFYEKFRDENVNMEFLMKHNFEKTLPKLIKKLKGKKVLFYGGGVLFQLINEKFNLSEINIIGVVDKVLSRLEGNEDICGYKLYSPECIKELNPDYVVVTTRRLFSVYEDLYFNYLKGTKIKITPLVKRDFITIIKEEL